MTPRAYDSSKRDETRRETRSRIVEATLELHTEKGILGTSWRDIAERADVAVATVYNHFPSLGELVPACGDLLMERLHPPAPEDIASILGDARTPRERLERTARELFAFYERGGAHLEVFPGERELPAVREWEAYQRSTVETYVRAALRSHRPSGRTVRLICAFFDLGTFMALKDRGVDLDEAVTTMTDAAMSVLERKGQPPAERRKG
jgi:AcrR family transcriptional regulator